MYSQFCHYIQQDEEKRRATMRIPRKPGEQVEVDWAGDPAQIIDPDTGELTKAWIFIGVMTYSQYTYAEAFVNQREPAWIKAHVHMYEYFGGVAKALVPDNASTAVDHREYDWYSPKLIRVYREMAEHYNTAIVPARIRKPRDKPNAEGSVNHASTWITAALRNEQFFCIEELNQAMPLVGTDAFAKAIKQYTNPRLLIIDEWLLTPLNDDEAKIVFEVIHKRRKKSSTIFCSQFLDEGWYERIGSDDNPLADSIMDRIKYDAYKIKIQAIDPDRDKSMREVYGLSPEEAE